MQIGITGLAGLLVWVSLSYTLAEPENLREGVKAPCLLYSYGKGPNGLADIAAEFRLALFNTKKPYVDDSLSAGDPSALVWLEERESYRKRELSRVHGRRVVRIDFDGNGGVLPSSTVVVAIEAAQDSGWYRPLVVAVPETLEVLSVVSNEVRAGLVVTLRYSGTSAYRTHHLFELAGKHPALISTLHSGRVVRHEFESDAAYEEALKVFELEKRLLSGQRIEQ